MGNMAMAVGRGTDYLISMCGEEGEYLEFGDSVRFGPSGSWVTGCITSVLHELGFQTERMLEYILRTQRRDGGWAYNSTVPADSDSTLRVLQYLALCGYNDETVIERAEQFVLKHQMPDGGITTFLPYLSLRLIWLALGSRNIIGWTTPHGCVSALALNVLREPPQSLKVYMQRYLLEHGFMSYWWKTPLYIANEVDRAGISTVIVPAMAHSSTIEISLRLIMLARHGIFDPTLVQELLDRQMPDGHFLAKGYALRIPRPHQKFDDVVPIERRGVRRIEENNFLFSTAAALIALFRQEALAA